MKKINSVFVPSRFHEVNAIRPIAPYLKMTCELAQSLNKSAGLIVRKEEQLHG